MVRWTRGSPWMLFAVASALYLATRQTAIAADGIYFEVMLSDGRVVNHHLLYLPLVWVTQRLGAPFGLGFEAAMKIVSALAGGGAVAMTFVATRRAGCGSATALVAALTMLFVPGFWFHATATEHHALHTLCALLLFIGLLDALAAQRGGKPLGRGSVTLCLAGAFLVPLSHLSGLAVGLPIAWCLWRTRGRVRSQVLGATSLGGAAFAGLFGTLYLVNPNLQEALAFSTSVSATGYAWSTTLSTAIQFGLYSLPASAFVPAGLLVLRRRDPRTFGLCLLWLLAWPAIVLRTIDDLYGSYHMPTVPVQLILAVTALRTIGTTPGRTLGACALAALPMASLWWDARTIGLVTWAAVALGFAVLAARRTDHPPGNQPPWALPIVTAMLATVYLVPILAADPVRATIRAIERAAAPADLILGAPRAGYERQHWARYFRKADGTERAIFPADLDWLTEYRPAALPATRATVLQTYRGVIQNHLSAGTPIWFVGELADADGSPELSAFYRWLRTQTRIEKVVAAPTPIYRLHSRG